MNRTKRLSLAVLALSSMALLSACGGSDDVTTTPPSSVEQEVAPSEEVVVDRLESKTASTAEAKLGLNNEQKFTENNYLVIDGSRKMTIDAYGTVDQTTNEEQAAEGEILHAVNLTFSGEELIPTHDENPLSDVVIDVDGSTTVTSIDLVGYSSLIVSAKPESNITLKVQTDGVTQEIDFKTGKRLTTDVAESWYLPMNGQITDGKFTQKLSEGVFKGKMTSSFNKAQKTAWTSEDGWADTGKASWLLIEADGPEWELTEGSEAEQKHEVWVEDSKGNKYETDSEWNQITGDEAILKFEVPIEESTFTIHTTSSADITQAGEYAGSFDEFSSKSTVVFK